jgi:hypothetical protein
MKPRYVISASRTQVLCDHDLGDQWRTIVLSEHDFPANAEKIASLMNIAFERGYQQAQADIRHALGVLK